mmetsp:Transcript_85766/g.223527  ORF Transcript_85766/g.223527 Transcript_85766/m.223527 type:complete len:224 (-) Transcript_85766:110-781(-)
MGTVFDPLQRGQVIARQVHVQEEQGHRPCREACCAHSRHASDGAVTHSEPPARQRQRANEHDPRDETADHRPREEDGHKGEPTTVVAVAYASVEPQAVVVEACHTLVAPFAMLGPCNRNEDAPMPALGDLLDVCGRRSGAGVQQDGAQQQKSPNDFQRRPKSKGVPDHLELRCRRQPARTNHAQREGHHHSCRYLALRGVRRAKTIDPPPPHIEWRSRVAIGR